MKHLLARVQRQRFRYARVRPVRLHLNPLEIRDLPSGLPAISIGSFSSGVKEGDGGSVTFLRGGDTSVAVDVTFSDTGGTATPSSDFSFSGHTVHFAALQTSQTATFTTSADGVMEGLEQIHVAVTTDPSYDIVDPASADIALLDQDGPTLNTPPPSGGATAPQAPGLGSGASGQLSGGVRAADGTVVVPIPGVWSAGFGQPFAMTGQWTNQNGYDAGGYSGYNLTLGGLPYLKTDGTDISVITEGTQAEIFDGSGGTYTPRHFSQDQLTIVTGETVPVDGPPGSPPFYLTLSDYYQFVTSAGAKLKFNDFSSSLPAFQGQLQSITDPQGNVTTVISRTLDAEPQEVQRTGTVGGVTLTESYLYTYGSSGASTDKVTNVTLRRKVGTGSWTTIRTADYTYHDGSTGSGTSGDLKTAVVNDGSGNPIEQAYYRYYTSSSSIGYAGAMKYSVSGAAYDRYKAWCDANSTTPDAASDSDLATFADGHYEYDAAGRTTSQTLAGSGATAMSYETSSFADGYNNWRTKSVQTLPDGTVNTVFTNFAGQTILAVSQPAGSSDQWCVYSRYDSAGRLILMAQPSAVSGYDEAYADLLHEDSGDYEYLRDDEGLIATTTYGASTTATSSAAGNVAGYQYQTFLQRGENGDPVLQSTTQYYSRTDGTITIYPVAGTTRYRNDDGTGGETTGVVYTYFSGTIHPQSVTATRPTATTGENGSNTSESDTYVMDDRGRVIWKKDAAGFLAYTEYDDVTGGVTKTINDVDTSLTTTFANLPSGWSTPSGGGLQQTTTYELDDQGRPTKTTDPNGNITYTVYDDADHEVRTYPGWNTSTNAPTGPTTVTREDREHGYSETLTMSATPSVSGGRPTGAESISSLQSLSRQVLNEAGQVVDSDQYVDLTGITYSTSSVTLGTAGTNYLRTEHAYDDLNRLVRTLTPDGTITRTVYDGLGRAVSQWVGTDDTPTTGDWSPSNTAGTNLVETSETEYDGGGVGDGDVTARTQIPGGGAPDRVTAYSYDWRDRQVATKAGVESSESSSVNRPITYVKYDNLGQAVVHEQYDGDGLSITTDSDSDGVPDRPSSSALRAKSVTSYDEQGRVYRDETYSVDPSSGSISLYSLRTDHWYDSRGLEIKTSSPGGGVTKTAYDGLRRSTVSYQTDGGGDSGYADADDVTGDNVLTQTEMTYDIGGQVELTTTRERFHDETGTGALGTPSTGNKARVSYQASFYDQAGRLTAGEDVGTNGGSAFTWPGTPDSPDDDHLVTAYGYDDAGRLETTTDPAGLVSKTYYDAAGRTVKSIENYVDGTVSDDDDKTVEYSYDANGQRATLRALLTGGGYQETEWVYGVTGTIDSNGMLLETRYPDATTGAASSSEKDAYTYDRLGEILTKTDRNGNVHTYAYDVLGRQVSDAVTTLGSGVDGSVRRVETNYDGQGNVFQVTTYDADSGGSVVNQIQRGYNGLGQMTVEYQATSGSVNTSTTPKVQYAYSEMASAANHSRPTAMTYPNGRVLDDHYDSGVDDDTSRLSSISDGLTTLESYEYLGSGTVVAREHPETGVDLTYVKLSGESDGAAGDQYTGLDAFSRVIDLRWTTSGGTAKDRFDYGYDRDGNRTYQENLVSSGNSESYSYDGLNQLTGFERGTLNGTKTGITGTVARSQSWDFDSLGNFDSQTTNGTAQSRTANKQNEITSVAGATTPAYDDNGNLTTDETGKTFTYDAWNRLATVTSSGSSLLATYKWDGTGRRAEEIRGGTTTDLYYSSQWQVLEERVGGTVKDSYAWSPVYADAMITRDRDTDANGSLDERLYVMQDASFDTTGLVNTSGAVVERYQYDPFGKFSVLDGSWSGLGASAYGWNYLHQGGRWDEDGTVYSFRNRELSPTLGRWLQNDPTGFDAGDRNFYRSYDNSAVIENDPAGLNGTIALPQSPPIQLPQIGPILGGATAAVAGFFSSPLLVPVAAGAAILGVGALGAYHVYNGGTLKTANQLDAEDGAFVFNKLYDLIFGKSTDASPAIDSSPAIDASRQSNQSGSPTCFPAGTPIRTPEGWRNIEDMRVGDLVFSRDEANPYGQIMAKEVQEVFVRSGMVWNVHVGGRIIETTAEHPFFVKDRGWVPCHELTTGDLVATENGMWLAIDDLLDTGEWKVLYNFRIADFHTYFVGCGEWGFSVWVHNAYVVKGGLGAAWHIDPVDVTNDFTIDGTSVWTDPILSAAELARLCVLNGQYRWTTTEEIQKAEGRLWFTPQYADPRNPAVAKYHFSLTDLNLAQIQTLFHLPAETTPGRGGP